MRKYVYMVYAPLLKGEEFTKYSFVFDNEDDADDKLAELVSIVGLPYFLKRKILVRAK